MIFKSCKMKLEGIFRQLHPHPFALMSQVAFVVYAQNDSEGQMSGSKYFWHINKNRSTDTFYFSCYGTSKEGWLKGQEFFTSASTVAWYHHISYLEYLGPKPSSASSSSFLPMPIM